MQSLADATRAIEQQTAPSEQTTEPPHAPSTPEPTPEQSLVHRLRGAIDKSGRYSHRLNDMTAGYSAGQGVPFTEARKAIEEKFATEVGMSPHQYLDRHYATRRENVQRGENGRPSKRSVEFDRER